MYFYSRFSMKSSSLFLLKLVVSIVRTAQHLRLKLPTTKKYALMEGSRMMVHKFRNWCNGIFLLSCSILSGLVEWKKKSSLSAFCVCVFASYLSYRYFVYVIFISFHFDLQCLLQVYISLSFARYYAFDISRNNFMPLSPYTRAYKFYFHIHTDLIRAFSCCSQSCWHSS